MKRKCPHCNGSDVVLYGKRKTKNDARQVFRCNSCRKYFSFSRFKNAKKSYAVIEVIAKDSIYGKNPGTISKELKAEMGVSISRQAIYKIARKSYAVKNYLEKQKDDSKIAEFFRDKKILVTGGAGFIGINLVSRLVGLGARVVRVFDVSEAGHNLLQKTLEGIYPKKNIDQCVRFLIGDVKDLDRLAMACEDIDFIFHLANLNDVRKCDYNALEAINVNIVGAQNVIEAALRHKVKKVVFASCEKAVLPNTTVGATKLLSERLFTSGNYYRGWNRKTAFATYRFGNVIAKGFFDKLLHVDHSSGTIFIPSAEAARFVMSIESATAQMLRCCMLTNGGEIFVAKMGYISLGELAKSYLTLFKNYKIAENGLASAELAFEELMNSEETSRALELDNLFVILPPLGRQLIYSFDKAKYPSSRSPTVKSYSTKIARQITGDELSMLIKQGGVLA